MSAPRYIVLKRTFANRSSWRVMDDVEKRFVAGPYEDSFAAHDKCARLNNGVTDMADRVTHKHIERAVAALNERRGLTRGDNGYLMYADIRGDGRYSPSFYAVINPNGGVTNVASLYRGATMRETLANVERATRATDAISWSGSPDPADPDNFWIDDDTGERVCAHCGARSKESGT